MLAIEQKTKVINGVSPDNVLEYISDASEPIIFKDFAQHWPIVKAGKASIDQGANYIREIYSNEPVSACLGDPKTKGRVFYNDDMTGFNYGGGQVDLNIVLDKLLAHSDDPEPPTMYMGSTEVSRWFPRFTNENPSGLAQFNPLTSIWIGNQSKIAAHYDFPHNLACSVIGERRFTLFPPEQIDNLYVGPMEFAPGGQDISLVDFAAPDFDKFPKFKDAVKHAQVAELGAGDALFLPSMWWHHVEGKNALNVLVTHWWRDTPGYMGRPNNALMAAILSIRSLPKAQRQAWQAIFNHYIFEHDNTDLNHIPRHALDVLQLPLDEASARKIRADLLNKLKR
ncbi:cupin-like domain-containing protein [Thalassotalea sp. LPB0316]|uniref:cupin-like domain-containing protein n=1 Tax=Thalassotalea sp. LPB0316 TaxID=2769490 RepID=UPI00186738CF|nr:cupin-like domain-containing protein [Thalassotalea sp. LPB0316]QOL24562.1 cupin-like domain-containing protein [Thalassotalea sp. LPB0316]